MQGKMLRIFDCFQAHPEFRLRHPRQLKQVTAAELPHTQLVRFANRKNCNRFGQKNWLHIRTVCTLAELAATSNRFDGCPHFDGPNSFRLPNLNQPIGYPITVANLSFMQPSRRGPNLATTWAAK
jgi:hypothetical protein